MVPNLPSPLVIPTAGTQAAPDAEGAGVDFFARLLGSGPMIAAIAGLSAPPADEVTLRAAPAEGEPEGAEDLAPDGAMPADIIPLLQAQSGFPVVVVPPTPVAAAPVPAVVSVPAATVPGEIGAAGGKRPETVPAAKPAQIARAVQPVPCQATEPEVAAASDDAPEADIVGAAVKAAVEKLRGKMAARPEKAARRDSVTPAEGAPVQPVATPGAQRQPEPTGARVEIVAQPAAAIPTAPLAPAFASGPVAPQPAAVAAAPASVPNVAELVVERQLDLANDDQWLDRLARDIARSGASDEPLRFRLHPQTLGHLQVELSQGDRGATVRLTVETEAARNILVDAQPRLAAEARAQGVRLAGTEVDLGTASQQGDPRRQAEARPQDIVRVVRSTQADTASSEPAQGRSDRYA